MVVRILYKPLNTKVMKRFLIYLKCYCLAGLLISCEDDGSNVVPEIITDVETTAGYGEIIFKWTNPDDENFYYVDISFVDSKGLSRSSKVSHFAQGDTITGFADTNSYTFNLTSCSYSGGASSPVVVTASPLEPAFSFVSATIEMVADFGGAVVSWDNETGKEVTVMVAYLANSGEKVTSTFDASETGKGYISGLSATTQTFTVTASDAAGNTSEEKAFEITPLEETAISKTGWSVVGYSSQEPAEGAPNGYVTAVFDDDVSTYWHSQWSEAQPGYPHWFIIDIGKEVTISRFECYRRQDDDRGQTECQFLTSRDGITWEDQGTYDFDSSTNDAQSYRMTSNPQARYFKYVATAGPNFYAFLGEITVFGAE